MHRRVRACVCVHAFNRFIFRIRKIRSPWDAHDVCTSHWATLRSSVSLLLRAETRWCRRARHTRCVNSRMKYTRCILSRCFFVEVGAEKSERRLESAKRFQPSTVENLAGGADLNTARSRIDRKISSRNKVPDPWVFENIGSPREALRVISLFNSSTERHPLPPSRQLLGKTSQFFKSHILRCLHDAPDSKATGLITVYRRNLEHVLSFDMR